MIEQVTKGKRKKSPTEKEKQFITRDQLLSVLKLGAVIFVAFTAPNAVKALRGWDERDFSWEDTYRRSSVSQCTTRLLRRGLVEVVETKDGYVVRITKKGKTELFHYHLDTLEIPKPLLWDEKWRMVFFDITEDEGKTRYQLWKYLKRLGFYQMQKSVYVYPYPCEKEIGFLREILYIPHSIKFAVVERMENDEDLREIFGLPVNLENNSAIYS